MLFGYVQESCIHIFDKYSYLSIRRYCLNQEKVAAGLEASRSCEHMMNFSNFGILKNFMYCVLMEGIPKNQNEFSSLKLIQLSSFIVL